MEELIAEEESSKKKKAKKKKKKNTKKNVINMHNEVVDEEPEEYELNEVPTNKQDTEDEVIQGSIIEF